MHMVNVVAEKSRVMHTRGVEDVDVVVNVVVDDIVVDIVVVDVDSSTCNALAS